MSDGDNRDDMEHNPDGHPPSSEKIDRRRRRLLEASAAGFVGTTIGTDRVVGATETSSDNETYGEPGAPPENWNETSSTEASSNLLSTSAQTTQSEAVSHFFTIEDIAFFGYNNNTQISSPQGEFSLDTGDSRVITVNRGNYTASGSSRFSLLTGDPVSESVVGYFAVDQNGHGLSTSFYTWIPQHVFAGEEFTVFSYHPDTNVTISNSETGSEIWSGTLDAGEHKALRGNELPFETYVTVTASKPVSALTYFDQGYYVPAKNQEFAGQQFYTYIGTVGGWTHDLLVNAYQDNTEVTIRNSETGSEIWSGTLDAGQSRVEPFNSETYVTVTSNKTITTSVQPWESWRNSSYHHHHYVPGRSGSLVGTDFIEQTLSRDYLIISAYQDGAQVQVIDTDTEDTVSTHTLDSGESVQANPGFGSWRITSDKPISIATGYGSFGGDFGPIRTEELPFERKIAERFAPNLHFGEHEKWFPTDPRQLPITRENGQRVVDGFDALNTYTAERKRLNGSPPWPTVFYDFTVAGGEENDPIRDRPLIVVSYWFYYVFNQFLNSHMHDWSVFHVFLDNRGGSPEPVLLVGRAHGPGKATLGLENNEYFKPEIEDVDSEVGNPAGVLEEVGAHASATDINDSRTTFEPTGDDPDITNSGAYELPREESIIPRPYLMPMINVSPGANIPLYQHEDLPDVTRSDLIEELTLRSRTGLEIPGFCGFFSEPPSDLDLPFRSHGKTLVNRGDELGGDHEYNLSKLKDIESVIEGFSGEELEQNVCLPFLIDDITFAKNFELSELQTSDYNPFQDITDSDHREEFAALFDFLTLEDQNVSVVEGDVFETRPGSEGAIKEEYSDIKDELADLIEFSLFSVSFEAMIILESEEIVLSTANGRFSIQASPGEHRLIINGPGYAPYAETFDLGDTGYQAGGAGRVSLVPNNESVKIGGELSDEEARIQRIQIANDFVGELYDSKPPVEENAFAVYVPQSGTYTVEVTDTEGNRGTFRIDPEPEEDEITIDIRTGKASLASYLADFLSDIAELTRNIVENENLAEDLADKFEAASASASRAADHARNGRAKQANNQLRTARNQINAALNQIDAQRGKELSEAAAIVLSDLAQRADVKAEEAIESSL